MFNNKAQMNFLTKAILMIIIISIVAVIAAKFFLASDNINDIFDASKQSCPEDTNIAGISKNIAKYASDDSPLKHSSYGIREFEIYLKCKGDDKFTSAETLKYEAGIIACAKVAYLGHIEELKVNWDKAKEGDTDGAKADEEYYKDLHSEYSRKMNIFNKLYHTNKLTAECNYQES